MNYKFLFKSIFLFLFFQLTRAQELSLVDAHDLLLSSNGNIKAAGYEVREKREEYKATKGLHFPEIKLNGNYMYLSEDVNLDLNPARDLLGEVLKFPDPQAVLGDWQMPLQERNFAMASAGVKWPLFTGGKINAATKAARSRLALAEVHQELEQEDLSIKLIDLYFKFKLAKEAEDLYLKVQETVNLHKEQADKLYENGQLAEVETLHAQVAFSGAKRDLMAAQKDVSLAHSALSSLLGGVTFTDLTTSFKQPVMLPSLEILQAEMLQAHKKLEELQRAQDLARAGIAAEKSEYFPKFAAIASHNIWRENMPLFTIDWYAGVGVSWNIFDGFQREHKLNAAKRVVDRLEELDEQARLDLLTYTHLLYNNLQKQKEQYESLQADEDLAKKLKFMRTRAFDEGMGTSLEVVDATLKLSEIQLKKLQALYEYNKVYGELMTRLGKEMDYTSQE